MGSRLGPAGRGHAAMLLFSILVAGSFSLGSMVADEIAPAALNTVRFAIAGVVVGVAVLATGAGRAVHFKASWRYIILGALFAAYFVLMFEGLKTAPPVSTSAVFTLTPALAAIAGYFLLRQITTRWMALALLIGGMGALTVIFRADVSALLAFDVGRGEMVFFVGVIAHAIYTPMVRLLNRGEPALVFSFGTICAGLVLLLLWGWSDMRATDWGGLRLQVWLTILYVAIAASSMTFVLLQYATMHLPSAKVMAYTYLTPSWVVIWEVMLGHGAPPVAILGGVALSCVALLMLLRDEPS